MKRLKTHWDPLNSIMIKTEQVLRLTFCTLTHVSYIRTFTSNIDDLNIPVHVHIIYIDQSIPDFRSLIYSSEH